MMRLTKRALSAFLAFVMVFTMLPLDVWAEGSQTSGNMVSVADSYEKASDNQTLELDSASTVIAVEGTHTFNASLKSEDGTSDPLDGSDCKWTSSKEDVATVKGGVVTGVGVGTAQITCTYGGLETFAMVTVTEANYRLVYVSAYPPDAMKYTYKNGGSASIGAATNTTVNETYKPGATATVASGIFTTINYDLVNYLGSDGNTYDVDDTITMNSNLMLTARWKRNGNTTSQQQITVRYYKISNTSEYVDKTVTATFTKSGHDEATVTFITGNNQDTIEEKYQDFYGWTIDGQNYTFNEQVTTTATDKDGSGIWLVEARPLRAGEEDNVVHAQFFIRKADADGYGKADQYYSVGSGTVNATDFERDPESGNIVSGTVAGSDNVNDNVNSYILTAPSAAQIANLMNITLDEASAVRWYVIKNQKDGFHVDGVIYLKDKYWRVEFVDPDTGKVVQTLLVEDADKIPVDQVISEDRLNNDLRDFTHWVDEKEEAVNLNDLVVTGDIRLTADFTRYSGYKVEYYLQNADNDEYTLDAQRTETHKEEVNEEVTVTPGRIDGYEFTQKDSITSGIVKKDETLVLKLYYDRIKYDVTYDYEGPIPEGANEKLPKTTTYKHGSTVEVAEKPEVTGYKFSGWTVKQGTVSIDSGTFNMPAENVVLVGSWSTNSYTVTYEWDGAAPEGANLPNNGQPYTYEYDEKVTVEADASVEGYTFDGWYTKEGSLVTVGADDTEFEMPAGNVTLYGKFTAIDYNVTYVLDDGSERPADYSVPTDNEKYNVGEAVTVKEDGNVDGYTFTGWYTKEGSLVTVGADDTEFEMPAGNVTLYGKFEIRTDLSYTINYYWVGDQTKPIAESETVKNQTFNAKVTLDDEKLKEISGYTLIENDYSTTIGVDKNEINVLYYKNVTLKADSLLDVTYDGQTHEVMNYTVTGAGDETVTFGDITAYGSGELVGNYPVEFFVNGTKVDVTKLVGEKDSNEWYYVTRAEEGTITITDDNVPDDKVVTKEDDEDDGYKYALGETVSYTITVKNIYDKTVKLDVSELPGVTIVDTVPETLGAGKEIIIRATYVIEEKDILNGSFTNHVTVTLNGNPFEGEETVTTVDITPALDVKKVAEPPANGTEYVLGETITYTITVKNTGNVTLADIFVSDEFSRDGGTTWEEIKEKLTPSTSTPITLEPDGEEIYTYQYTVVEEDLGKTLYNTAIASTEFKNTQKPEEPSTKVEDGDTTSGEKIENRNPELKVVKTASSPKDNVDFALGETINYTITLTNTGNVTLNVSIRDMFGTRDDGSTIQEDITSKLTCQSENFNGTLEPDASVTYTYSYTVTEADLGKDIVNTVKYTAVDDTNVPAQQNEESVTEVTSQTDDPNPNLKVVKTVLNPNEAPFDYNKTIQYQITVTNEGNVTLNDINLVDELKDRDGNLIETLNLADDAKNFSLAPKGHEGDSKTFNVSYTVKEADLGKTLKNTATAIAPNPDDPTKPVEGKGETDGEETKDPTPGLDVTKEVVNKQTSYRVGDVITYQITVKNTGNTTIHNIKLTDVMQASGDVKFTSLDSGKLENGVPVRDSLKPKTNWVVNCQYTVQLADADSEGTVISNKVVVTSDEGPDDDSETPGEDIDPIYTLTIKYQNGARVDLRNPDTVKLHAGDVYTVVAPGINGYHLSDKAYAEFDFTMRDRDTTIVIIYAANPVEDDDDDPVVNPDNDPDETTEETTEETEDEVDPGVYIEDPDDYTLTPITEEEPPLADLDVGDHTCCIMHFLLMLAAMVVLGFYTDSKKKHQARIFELKKTLAMEKGKNPGGDNSQQS